MFKISLFEKSGDRTVDATARQEVVLPKVVGSYDFTQDSQPLFFDSKTAGAGSVSHLADGGFLDLSVSNAGDFAIAQTFNFHGEVVGCSKQVELAYVNLEPEDGVVKRVGYFSSSTVAPCEAGFDGCYLESSDGAVSLVVANNGVVNKKQINKNIDWSKLQVSIFDFLSGSASVSLYHRSDGMRRLIERYNSAGRQMGKAFKSGSQPIRLEVRSTGGAGSLRVSSASVREMLTDSLDLGLPFDFDSGPNFTLLEPTGLEYVLIGLRQLKRERDIRSLLINTSTGVGPADVYRWRLLLNPTLSTPLSYSSEQNGVLEFAKGNGVTVTSGGYCLASGSAAARAVNYTKIGEAIRLGVSIVGDKNEVVLAVTPASANQKHLAVISGRIF